jgi:hypothetical protein
MNTQPMEKILVALVLTQVGASGIVWAADLVHAKDGSGVYGYKDTPKLPWCQWLVHDPDRPNPKKVDPGKAGPPAPVPADAIVLFDGQDMSLWQPAANWKVAEGCLIAGDGAGAFRGAVVQPRQQRRPADGSFRNPNF